MFKKYFIYFYLTFISFIAGALFIIQCGQQVQALADALGIDYDNSSSNLSATTVQGAIDELATTVAQVSSSIPALPSVYEANGNKIGTYLGNTYGVWEVWDTTRELIVNMEPSTGTLVTESGYIYFTTTDCTGTTYRLFNPSGDNNAEASFNSLMNVNGTLYKFVNGGATATYDKMEARIQSYRIEHSQDQPCSLIDEGNSYLRTTTLDSDDLDNQVDSFFIEATPIEEPIFTGPLYIE